jgi:ABC-2 type transport system ATP-binding protein
MSTGQTVIEVQGLRRSYGAVEAVQGIDLHVDRGEVVALLGPNGAGKTTTVEILEGFRERTAGDVSVLGHDPSKGEPAFKARIGIVLQTTGAENYLSAREIVALYAGYYPSPRPVPQLLELVGLTDSADVRVGRLSGGQRRRLDLAIALAGSPELLFLDEPTTGFDPSARRGAWDIIRGLASDGTTILLTTHFMDEAQVLADRIAVIVAGSIVAEGTTADVIGAHSRETRVRVRLPAGVAAPDGFGLAPDPVDPGWLLAQTMDPTDHLHRLTGWAMEQGVAFEDLAVARPTLEETYLALTGTPQDESGLGEASAGSGTAR